MGISIQGSHTWSKSKEEETANERAYLKKGKPFLHETVASIGKADYQAMPFLSRKQERGYGTVVTDNTALSVAYSTAKPWRSLYDRPSTSPGTTLVDKPVIQDSRQEQGQQSVTVSENAASHANTERSEHNNCLFEMFHTVAAVLRKVFEPEKRRSLQNLRTLIKADKKKFKESGLLIPGKNLFKSNSPLVEQDEALIRHTLRKLSEKIRKDIKKGNRDVLEQIDTSLTELSAREFNAFDADAFKKAIKGFQIKDSQNEAAAQNLGQLIVERFSAARKEPEVAVKIFKPSVIAYLKSPEAQLHKFMRNDRAPAVNFSKILNPYGFFQHFHEGAVEKTYLETFSQYTTEDSIMHLLLMKSNFLSSSEGKEEEHEQFADFIKIFLKHAFQHAGSTESFLNRLNPGILEEFADAEKAIQQNETTNRDKESVINEFYTNAFIIRGLLPAMAPALAKLITHGDHDNPRNFCSEMKEVISRAAHGSPMKPEWDKSFEVHYKSICDVVQEQIGEVRKATRKLVDAVERKEKLPAIPRVEQNYQQVVSGMYKINPTT